MRDIVVYDIQEYDGVDGEYIGRGSILGNPFYIGRDGDRDKVIDKYETWLRSKGKDSAEQKELHRLMQKASYTELHLLCHCAPRRCHGDIIRKVIEEMAVEEK